MAHETSCELIALVTIDKDAVATLTEMDNLSVVGIIDIEPFESCLGIRYIGRDSDWEALKQKNPNIAALILADPPDLKRRISKFYPKKNWATVIATGSTVHNSTNVGRGTFVQAGCKIMPDCEIGDMCKINLDVTIHHDCHVGDFCTIAPGARLLGRVTLSDDVFVGAGSVILPHISVGRGATIGAGSVVTRDVADGEVVMGAPAKSR